MDDIIQQNLHSFIYTFGSIALMILLYSLNKISGDFIVSTVKKIFKNIYEFIIGDRIDAKSQNIIYCINNDLSELRVYTEASRAFVLEFHNGSEYLSNFPQWKLSQSYEKNAPGISYNGYEFQNIPATLIWDDYLKIFFDKDIELPKGIIKIDSIKKCPNMCSENRPIFLITTENLDYDAGPTRSLFEKRGVKYSIQTPIISNFNKSIIGIAGLDYIDEKIDLNEINECFLCKFSSNLAFIWNDSIKKQKLLKHHIKNLQE
jgi:hypothetical protein